MPTRKPSPRTKRRRSLRGAVKGEIRTNVVVDRALVEIAKMKANVGTAREAIHAALRDFVKPYDYSGLLKLRGADCIAEDYEPGVGGTAKFLGWERVFPINRTGRKRSGRYRRTDEKSGT